MMGSTGLLATLLLLLTSFFTTTTTTLASPLDTSSSLSFLSTRQYQDANSPLLVDNPACDFYKCIVTWYHGQSTFINWINAPYGTVRLSMMINDNADVAYEIANVSSPSQPGYCDDGSGIGTVNRGSLCGRFAFIVPSEWTTGRNYSVRATLVGNEDVESYTDVIQIQEANGTSSTVSYPLSTVTISGAPTATQDGSSTVGSFSGTYTAATSPGGGTPGTSAAASTGSASSSSSSSSGSSATATAAAGGSASSSSAPASASTTSSAPSTNAASTIANLDRTSNLAFITFSVVAVSMMVGLVGLA